MSYFLCCCTCARMENSPYFCAFNLLSDRSRSRSRTWTSSTRTVKQKVWTETKNRARMGRDAKNTFFFSLARPTGVWDSSASRAGDSLAILTLNRFWEKNPTVLLSTRVHFRYFSQKREITFEVATFGGVLFSGGSLLLGFPNTSEFYCYFRAIVTSGTLRNLSFESTFWSSTAKCERKICF